MSTGKKTPHADRSRGGPGSSHQGSIHRTRPDDERREPEPGQPTSGTRSRVSGGGGERDRHHRHHPTAKR